MKYHINRTKDTFPLNQEHAIDLAKKQLNKSGYFAAIYGKNVNGKKEFHTPILVSESSLRSTTNELKNEDPDSALYVVYREHIDDAPTYEVEYRGGEAYLDLPDEEVADFIKGKMKEIIDNPRLYQKYKYELEDLFEEDLQRYVDEQFYKHNRGEVYKDSMKDARHKPVTLYYNDLKLELQGSMIHPDRRDEPAEYEEFETTEEFEYEADEDEVGDALYDILSKENPEMDYDDIDDLIERNWDDLVDKYEDQIAEILRPRAEKAAEEYYQKEFDEGSYDDRW